jgi:histone arginine demethylase JMJD6
VGEDDDGHKIRTKLKYYLEYVVHNTDDSPLYLFESSLESRPEMQSIIDHYKPPKYFQDDILKYAGESRRPPYRWLLIGPERSGTTVHIDPLYTSAWNTSLAGHKRWVLFPESVPKGIVKGYKHNL